MQLSDTLPTRWQTPPQLSPELVLKASKWALTFLIERCPSSNLSIVGDLWFLLLNDCVFNQQVLTMREKTRNGQIGSFNGNKQARLTCERKVVSRYWKPDFLDVFWVTVYGATNRLHDEPPQIQSSKSSHYVTSTSVLLTTIHHHLSGLGRFGKATRISTKLLCQLKTTFKNPVSGRTKASPWWHYTQALFTELIHYSYYWEKLIHLYVFKASEKFQQVVEIYLLLDDGSNRRTPCIFTLV